MNDKIFRRALRYSMPVLLGYAAIGIAFGLLAAENGYPWYLALIMSIVMYAGAGQYIAIGMFAAGAGLLEMIIIQFVVNARHIAYGITMLSKFKTAGKYKLYLIFALTDETFALLSSLPDSEESAEDRSKFMFWVSLLDQTYWVLGTLIGALAGSIIPFSMQGIDYALTALFMVLLIEQIMRIKRAAPFVISALCAALAAAFLPANVSLISALAVSLAAVHLIEGKKP